MSEVVLGRYRLQRLLGSGAFATVWAARDLRLERDVAVKAMPRARVEFSRFEREARAAARLAHPAIVLLYEAAVDDEAAYLVSELVRGKTMGELLAGGKLSDRAILAIAIAICDALAHAHAEGVIHRDLKPSNILVPARPSAGPPAKLTDFGVARVVGGDALTQAGNVIGTAAYMAPEQARGREADGAADLYALALVAYEGLSGTNPAARAGAPRSRVGRRSGARPEGPLPPLRRQRRAIPPEVAAAVDRALAVDPRERGSVQDLRAALEWALERVDDTPGVITPSGWLGRPEHDREEPEPGREWEDAQTRAQTVRAHARDHAGDGPRGEGARSARRAPVRWPWRAAGALSAALTAWWLCGHLLAHSPIAPTAAGLLAAAVALVLPRLGLAFGGLALIVLAVAQGAPGGALLVAVMLAATVAVMPTNGRAWTLPCGAVLLGTISLAGAWPALLGRSGVRMWQRAAIAGAGYVWLASATALTGTNLYAHTHPAFPAPGVWASSLTMTLHDVLIVMVDSGVLAGAAVWALSAALAPLLVNGRSLTRDALIATLWASATLMATELCGRLLGSGAAPAPPRGAVLGAVLGAGILIAPTLARARHPGERGRIVPGRLP